MFELGNTLFLTDKIDLWNCFYPVNYKKCQSFNTTSSNKTGDHLLLAPAVDYRLQNFLKKQYIPWISRRTILIKTRLMLTKPWRTRLWKNSLKKTKSSQFERCDVSDYVSILFEQFWWKQGFHRQSHGGQDWKNSLRKTKAHNSKDYVSICFRMALVHNIFPNWVQCYKFGCHDMITTYKAKALWSLF